MAQGDESGKLSQTWNRLRPSTRRSTSRGWLPWVFQRKGHIENVTSQEVVKVLQDAEEFTQGKRTVLQRRLVQFQNMTRVAKGKEKGKRDRPISLSPGLRSPRKDSKDGKGVSPVWENEPTFVSQLFEKCTTPSCDYWHPPDCVKHKTNEGCEDVRFFSVGKNRQLIPA